MKVETLEANNYVWIKTMHVIGVNNYEWTIKLQSLSVENRK